MRTSVVLAVLLASLAPAALAAEPARVASQSLSVRFEPAGHGIRGQSVLTLAGAADEPRSVRFRIHSGLEVAAFLLKGGGYSPVSPARDEADGYWRRVEVPVPTGADSLLVRYEGTLYDAVKKAEDLSFVVGDDTRGVIGEEGIFLTAGSGWYPRTEGLAVFTDVRVDVPERFRAVTQGGLDRREVANGREITRWTSDTPVEGVALQAGEYSVSSREVLGVKLSTYLFERDRGHAKLFLDEAERILRFYVPILGDYPWPKFDLVENFFTTGYGMPSYTLLGDDVVRVMVMMARRSGGRIPPGYLDHEMVHCWWGNYVYPDYESGNWCEGLTSWYANYLMKEAESAEKAFEHRKRISTTFSIRVGEENDYPLRRFRGKKEDFENDIGYGKGCMLFHMLARRVGYETFFETMRGIVRDHGGRLASWADFESAFSKAAGEDLGWFFDQWLDRTGAPSLRMGDFTVERGPGGLYVVRGEVLQDGEPWRVRAGVTVEHAGGESYRDVEISGAAAAFEVVSPRPPLRVKVDSRFHLLRKIPLDEIQPCLNLTLSRPEKVYVLPDEPGPYERLARMAQARKGGEVAYAGDGLPDADCVLFGRPGENPAVAEVLAAAGVGWDAGELTVKGVHHGAADQWLLLSTRHPTAEGRFVTVFFGTSEKALARARVIFHYGWDGYLVYAGRPVARGDFTEIRPRAERAWEISVDGAAVREDVAALTARELHGRLAGSEGGRRARKILKARLEAAGVRDVTESPFTFTIRDFDDPDSWTVPQGGGDGIEWVTSDPGAVVPAVFSETRPDPIPIRRIAKYGSEADGGTLLVLPPETRVRGLMLLLTAAADSGAAAIGIPMEVLESEDPAMRALAAYPSRPAGRPSDDPWRAAAGTQARAPVPPVDLPMPVVFVDSRLLPPGGEGEANARLRVRFTERTVESASLLGVLPAADGRTEGPWVGLSAHYDGCGSGHQGADDNASGVAAVLAACRTLSARPGLLSRPVLVMLPGGEEWGLRGSTALARSVARDLTALVNLDTIGAKDQPEVFLVGRSRHPKLSARAAECLEAEGFRIGRDIDRFAFAHGSDHWPFHEAGVSAVDLYSGSYRRMNSKEDTVAHLHFGKIVRIARATARLVMDLSAEDR